MVAVAEYSPYVINVLENYEKKLRSSGTASDLKHYEYAFMLHKSVQSYLLEHTSGALTAKADAPVMSLFSYFKWFGTDKKKAEYEDVICSVLADFQKTKSMKCHTEYEYKSNPIEKKKVLQICCPVDVLLTDAGGNTVAKIENNIVTAQTPDVSVSVWEDKKFIAMDYDFVCDVHITATDDGTMDFAVLEYDNGVLLNTVVNYETVPLVYGGEFSYTISAESEQSDLISKNPDPATLKNRPGDVDGNGQILADDARLALRASAKLETLDENQEKAADVDGSGDVLANDARQILRYSAKLQHEFEKK